MDGKQDLSLELNRARSTQVVLTLFLHICYDWFSFHPILGFGLTESVMSRKDTQWCFNLYCLCYLFGVKWLYIHFTPTVCFEWKGEGKYPSVFVWPAHTQTHTSVCVCVSVPMALNASLQVKGELSVSVHTNTQVKENSGTRLVVVVLVACSKQALISNVAHKPTMPNMGSLHKWY